MINIWLGMVRHNMLLLEKELFVLELNFISNTCIVVYCIVWLWLCQELCAIVANIYCEWFGNECIYLKLFVIVILWDFKRFEPPFSTILLKFRLESTGLTASGFLECWSVMLRNLREVNKPHKKIRQILLYNFLYYLAPDTHSTFNFGFLRC